MDNITFSIPVAGAGLLDKIHAGDAGYDLVAQEPPRIIGARKYEKFFTRILYVEYNTEVVIAPPEELFSVVLPRSSVTSNTNLILGNCVGLIDTEYRGFIKLRFRYIPQPEDFTIINDMLLLEPNEERIYQQGDRIGQLVFMKHADTVLKRVNLGVIEGTRRGSGGFGSTGR